MELKLKIWWNSGIYDGPLDKTIFKWMLGRKQHNQIQLVTEQVRIKDLHITRMLNELRVGISVIFSKIYSNLIIA